MLEENKTDKRVERHKISQEDFTPEEIVAMLYSNVDELSYSDFSKTFLDPCAGICYILVYCLKKRLQYCKTVDDIKSALSTLYGTELFEDNVIEGRQNMIDAIVNNTDIKLSDEDIQSFNDILTNNIVCTDTFKWDYEHWKPIPQDIQIELF